MSNNSLISSAHDDWLVPWFRRFEREDLPDERSRYHTLGGMWQHSVLSRLTQFGITEADLLSEHVEDLSLLTSGQYDRLIAIALRRHFDVAMVSVFARYGSDLIVPERADKMLFARLLADRYTGLGIPIIRAPGDLDGSSPSILLCLEGADVIDEVRDVDTLYDMGIRCIALQYGHDNLVSLDEGLTPLGRQVVERIFAKRMIVDLAHSAPQVRHEILDLAEGTGNGHRVLYTHGGTLESMLCDPTQSGYAEKRGITPSEIARICRLNGLVAFGGTRPFHTGAAHLAKTIASVANLENGVECVAIGTDFGGVAPQELTDITAIPALDRLIGHLNDEYGFDPTSLEKVMRTNVREKVRRGLV